MAFMTHPQHGATYTNKIEEHEKNGWKQSTTEEWLASKFPKKPDLPDDQEMSLGEDDDQGIEPRRRGRPRIERD